MAQINASLLELKSSAYHSYPSNNSDPLLVDLHERLDVREEVGTLASLLFWPPMNVYLRARALVIAEERNRAHQVRRRRRCQGGRHIQSQMAYSQWSLRRARRLLKSHLATSEPIVSDTPPRHREADLLLQLGGCQGAIRDVYSTSPRRYPGQMHFSLC
eukprot:PhF_6_TR11716/c0_g1_i1/m.19093